MRLFFSLHKKKYKTSKASGSKILSSVYYFINKFTDAEERNKILEEARKVYEKEYNSLEVTLYETKNFEVDEFKFLMINKDLQHLDETLYKIELKLNFEDKYQELISRVLEHYKKTYNVELSVKDLCLYQFSYSPETKNVNLTNKFENDVIDKTIKDLKIYHKTNLIINVKQNSAFEEKIVTWLFKWKDLSKIEIGSEYSIITLNLLYKSESKIFKVKSNTNFLEFKQQISSYLNIKGEIFITAQYNNTVHEIEQYTFNKKHNAYLTLQQLRFSDNYLIIIKQDKSKSEFQAVNSDEEINCIVEYGEEEKLIISTKLTNTYGDVFNTVKEKLGILENEFIRIRK